MSQSANSKAKSTNISQKHSNHATTAYVNAIPRYPSAPKCGKMNSNVVNPALNPKAPQSGDLVVGLAGDIHHSATDYLTINPSYIVFGVVRVCSYVK